MVVADLEAPCGPRVGIEGKQAFRCVRPDRAGAITLHGQWNARLSRRILQPGLHAVHQHHAPRRRLRGREKQRVISAGPFGAGCARCKAAKSIGFKPFVVETAFAGRTFEAGHFWGCCRYARRPLLACARILFCTNDDQPSSTPLSPSAWRLQVQRSKLSWCSTIRPSRIAKRALMRLTTLRPVCVN